MSRFPQLFPVGGSSGPLLPVGWDKLTLGGIVLAGRWKLTGGALKLKIDPKKKAGATAPSPTTHGLDPQTFTARGVVWTQAQLDELDDQLAILLPPLNLQPVTLDHPQAYSLARVLGKIDVQVEVGSIWLPSSIVRGGYEITLNLPHWLPAAKGAKGNKAKSSTPDQSKRNLLAEADAQRRAGVGVGTVYANPPPSSSPDFAKPTWP